MSKPHSVEAELAGCQQQLADTTPVASLYTIFDGKSHQAQNQAIEPTGDTRYSDPGCCHRAFRYTPHLHSGPLYPKTPAERQ
jgi:hypothetical protein